MDRGGGGNGESRFGKASFRNEGGWDGSWKTMKSSTNNGVVHFHDCCREGKSYLLSWYLMVLGCNRAVDVASYR